MLEINNVLIGRLRRLRLEPQKTVPKNLHFLSHMYYAMGMWDASGSNKSEETNDSNSEEI
jgi:hypothetical protein